MKKFILVAALLALTACERGLTERERECMELTNDSSCIREVRATEYGPVAPGNYTNYYGSPDHGTWDSSGNYHFRDPNSSYATQTNAFLLGAGLGGLAAYALTKNANRSSWVTSNPNGYRPEVRTTTKYIGKGGREISRSEYDKRAAQSAKDKAAAQVKREADAKRKQQAQAQADAKRKQQQQAQTSSKPLNFTKPSAAPKPKPLNFTKPAAAPKPKPMNFTKSTSSAPKSSPSRSPSHK